MICYKIKHVIRLSISYEKYNLLLKKELGDSIFNVEYNFDISLSFRLPIL